MDVVFVSSLSSEPSRLLIVRVVNPAGQKQRGAVRSDDNASNSKRPRITRVFGVAWRYWSGVQ